MLPNRHLLLPLALLVAAAQSAQASPVQASLEFEATPGCITGELCIVGHTSGPEPGPQDDTLHASTVVRRAALDIEPGAGIPRQELALDHDDTYLETPVLRQAEETWNLTDQHIPQPLRSYIHLWNGSLRSGGEGFGISVWPWRLAPVSDPDVPLDIPVLLYNPHVWERDRIYPLGDGGTTPPLRLDRLLDLAAWTMTQCRPEETQHLQPECEARAALGPAAVTALKSTLPDVSVNAGLQRAEVHVGPNTIRSQTTEPDATHGRTAATLTTPGAASHIQEPAFTHHEESLQPLGPKESRARSPLGPPAPASALVPSSNAAEPMWLPAVGLATTLALLAWALYRRLHRTQLLQHPNRQAILATIEARPGITIGELASDLGVSYKTAMHHADLLIDAGHVSVHLVGRHRRLFASRAPLDRARREALVVADRPSSRRVLEALDRLGPIPLAEVPRCAGVSRTSAWKAMRDLTRTGWVTIKDEHAYAAPGPGDPA